MDDAMAPGRVDRAGQLDIDAAAALKAAPNRPLACAF
jgi:hypothetical protein